MSNFYTDNELADLLKDKISSGQIPVYILVNKFNARTYVPSLSNPKSWEEVGCGDLGVNSVDILKPLCRKKNLYWASTLEKDLTQVAFILENFEKVNSKDLNDWLKECNKITQRGGREGEVSNKTKFEVSCAAAWRCQFDGCGTDLRQHVAPGQSGNYSYYAHIVASSQDGPRGSSDSARLADDPSNIMLMCDKCHRLIDRVKPSFYSIQMLREMRERNITTVNRLLNSLSYPEVQMLVICGNIEGQASFFNRQLAEEAIWLKQLRSISEPPEWFLKNTHLSSSNTTEYWINLFSLLKTRDIPRLKTILDGTAHAGGHRLPLAIFALHSTSILILVGRLIGESSPVHLFQFHRNQISGKGGQWAWPETREPDPKKYKVKLHKDVDINTSEAILQVNLTASILGNDLPAFMYRDNSYTMPAIEITIDQCSHNAISHPKDLELLGLAIDEAFQKLQDEWHIRTVHLIVIGPTTACIRIGQKMQARHHADFILYERKPSSSGLQGEFEPTIRISSTRVALVSTGDHIDIS